MKLRPIMAQTYQPRRTVRVLASHANVGKVHRTVNIVTTKAADPANSIPTRLQAAGVSDTIVETVIYSGGTNVAGLPTIFISGFTAAA